MESATESPQTADSVLAAPHARPSSPLVDPILRMSGLRHQLVNRQSVRSSSRPKGSAPGARSVEADVYEIDVPQLVIPRSSFCAVQGASGCGKTSLLTILGLARRPERELDSNPAVDSFEFFPNRMDPAGSKVLEAQKFDLKQLWSQRSSQIDALRRQYLGFCLQRGELLENLTVEENVEMPLMLNGKSARAARERTELILTLLSTNHESLNETPELVERRRQLPMLLSGGQYQRVALARALAHQPQLLFLDEPTGSLDPKKAEEVLVMLNKICDEEQVTIVMITHDAQLAKRFAEFRLQMESPRMGQGVVASFHRKLGDPQACGSDDNEEWGNEEWVETDASWMPLQRKTEVTA